MAIFVKFGDYDGEATLQGHTGYSLALHFHWAGAKQLTQQSQLQVRGRAKFESAAIVKPIDSTSTMLLEAFKRNETLLITVKTTNVADRTPGNVAYEIIFKNASIVGFDYNFSEGSLTEKITIDYEEYDVTYFDPQTGGGRSNAVGSLTYE